MDTTTQKFWQNKLFWTGLIGAIIIAVQQIVFEPVIDWKAMGFAAFIGIGGYVATTLRGQNISMYSMIANVLMLVVTDAADQAFNWKQLVLQASLQVLAWISSDAKPVGYERADAILNAKIQGQIVTPNVLVDNKVKKAAESAISLANGDVNVASDIAGSKVTTPGQVS